MLCSWILAHWFELTSPLQSKSRVFPLFFPFFRLEDTNKTNRFHTEIINCPTRIDSNFKILESKSKSQVWFFCQDFVTQTRPIETRRSLAYIVPFYLSSRLRNIIFNFSFDFFRDFFNILLFLYHISLWVWMRSAGTKMTLIFTHPVKIVSYVFNLLHSIDYYY